MNRTLGRVFAWCLLAFGAIAPQIMDPETVKVLGLSAAAVKLISIGLSLSGFALSYLPTAWKSKPE